MKIAIIQARCASTRFPGKIFADLSGKPLIWHVVNRLRYCNRIDKIMIATTLDVSDERLAEWAQEQGISTYRGSVENVLNRYYCAAQSLGLKNDDIIIRITADDPFKEPALIDKVIEMVEKGEADFAYNNKPPTYPEGLDCEVFTMKALEKSEKESSDSYEREHVTQYMYRHPELFTTANISQKEDLSYMRLTLDTSEDYEMAQEIYNRLYNENEIFTLEDILELLKMHSEICAVNSNVARSAMYINQ
jgi:spore coat polysaccharide biosynthesis protein SpsF